MATKPGPLTKWPWQNLDNFKYLLFSPLVLNAMRGDDVCLLLLAVAGSRYIQAQVWITISRYYNAKGRNIIQTKGIDFNQIDREATWDDQILFHTLLVWLIFPMMYGSSKMPMWDAKGIIVMAIVHAGPAEFLYYWGHRALHHHSLYTMYHSHHHSSFVTEPITSVVHPFAEHIAYFVIFAIAPLTASYTGTLSQVGLFLYFNWLDFFNNMGHCNFEFMPTWAFKSFPPLKYLIYTPSYHSLHHSQVHTNFSLFMPLYDHVYGTLDKSTDELFVSSSKGKGKRVDFVYLTHFTDMMSIFHLRLGISSLSGRPYFWTWYIWLLSPIALAMRIIFNLFGETFVCERNRFEGLEMQTWVIPRYITQYKTPSRKAGIKKFMEQSILDAEKSGVKVIGLGLLNKGILEDDELILKHIHKIKIADGTTLAAAWVINSIPGHEKQVLILCDTLTRLDLGVVRILCERGFNVQLICESYDKVMQSIPKQFQSNLTQAKSLKMAATVCKTWIVGREIGWKEQLKAQKGTKFVPMMALPITAMRKDCFYESTPAMKVPNNLENLHSCEVRRLPIGDATWIARHKTFRQEYVLDFIVERKKVNDLSISIKDNRYRDQKLRLMRCGIQRLIYLIEGDPNLIDASESIKSAAMTTEILEGFDVQRTKDLSATIRKYGNLTKAIAEVYNMISLNHNQYKSKPCMTYDGFVEKCCDLEKETVSDVFGVQLMQVPQVTEDIALAILDHYPTVLSLAKAYASLEGDKLGQENLLKDIPIRSKSKTIGSTTSKRIYNLIWDDGQ